MLTAKARRCDEWEVSDSRAHSKLARMKAISNSCNLSCELTSLVFAVTASRQTPRSVGLLELRMVTQ